MFGAFLTNHRGSETNICV